MKYLQCEGHISRAEKAEQVWLNARAVAVCRFDINGHLGR